jgi:phage tail-like protein
MTRPRSDELLPQVLRMAAGVGTPLGALCDAMEALLTPAERALDDIDAWLDAYRAPDTVLPYLATWAGLGHLLRRGPNGMPTFEGGTGRLRLLVAEAASLTRTRGTPGGLLRTLFLATGHDGFVLDERPVDAAGRPRPFHLVVYPPAGAEAQRELIARIVDADRPAYLTFEIAPPTATPPP